MNLGYRRSLTAISSLGHFFAVAGLLAVTTIGAVGCQTSIGGQTLPSAYYLRDDVQYYPAGPEFLLSNQVRAIEQYKAERGDGQDLGP